MLFDETEMQQWPRGSDEFVEAFAKGLGVIGAFSGRRNLSLSDVAKSAGIPRATARRLLLTLVKLRLAKLDDGRFSLTPRVLRLGYAYLSTVTIREVAQPVIETLARQANEVVGLSVLDGHDLVYIGRSELVSVLRTHLTIGSRLPAFCTSMGRIHLAALPEQELDDYFAAAKFPAYTRYTKTSEKLLRAEIAKARREGWAIASQELELGALGMAAAIRDASGRTVAAINLGTNLARYTPEKFAKKFRPLLMKAAAEISSLLGS